MDIIDTAAEIEELQRNAAISLHRVDHSAISATHCVECRGEIKKDRQEAMPGCQMCASCQSDAELRARRL